MLNPPVPDISIIIPAKDEERRLPTFLLDVISFCQASAQQYEIIVVDDGSRDGTSAVVEKFQAKFARLHLIVLKKTEGKGMPSNRASCGPAGISSCLWMQTGPRRRA